MADPDVGQRIFPAETPGPQGLNDQADPSVCSLPGSTPGPTGLHDYSELVSGAPRLCLSGQAHLPWMTSAAVNPSEGPMSGAIPVGVGAASKVRIPMPGSGGLHVEFTARGRVPKGGSDSMLFIQDLAGRRQLRLDFGHNKNTDTINYHWNQKGVYEIFKIHGHTPAGPEGRTLYEGARYFRNVGRTLGIIGITVDLYSIVVAKKRWRRVAQVAAGWTGAVVGCKIVGAGGAVLGTAVTPGPGTAVGGVGGCIAGGIGGYIDAEWAAGELYDWVEETYFEPLPEVEAPPDP